MTEPGQTIIMKLISQDRVVHSSSEIEKLLTPLERWGQQHILIVRLRVDESVMKLISQEGEGIPLELYIFNPLISTNAFLAEDLLSSDDWKKSKQFRTRKTIFS